MYMNILHSVHGMDYIMYIITLYKHRNINQYISKRDCINSETSTINAHNANASVVSIVPKMFFFFT